MAEKKALIFKYYEEISHHEENQLDKCKFCTANIKGKLRVTSNFVTHLKVSTVHTLLTAVEHCF